jgi:hypothetical protein
MHLSCLGVTTLEWELLVYSLLPLAMVVICCSFTWVLRRDVVSALPFVLRLTYLLYPAISSKGFQTLGNCDCFTMWDGSPSVCFLPADYSVECHGNRAPFGLLALGLLAVLLYGIGVPVLYGLLLFACRDAIRNEKKTSLANALRFLHSAFHPSALYWPLVEALRAILLTGALALLVPGHIFQLLCGLLVTFTFCCLQLWALPYRTKSNNFLAMVVNVSLVLNFVGTIGVQINSQYYGDIDSKLLQAALFTAALAVFPLPFFSLLAKMRKPLKHTSVGEQRSELLDDHARDPHDGPLPLPHAGSINAAQDRRASH